MFPLLSGAITHLAECVFDIIRNSQERNRKAYL